MANQQEIVNGFDAEAIVDASSLQGGSGEQRVIVNGYDARIITNVGGNVNLPADVCRIGWGSYFNGDLTPINIPAGVETKLTLDTTNGVENETYLPLGASGLWNSTTSQFDFSTLEVGDMVDIRVDGSLTNSGINESFVLNFVGAIGTAGEYTLPFSSGNRLIPGTSVVSRYNGIFIGSEDTKNNPSELRIVTTDAASGFLIDIYLKVLKRNG